MNDDLIFSILTFGVGAYFLTIWIHDFRSTSRGLQTNAVQIPGTVKAPLSWIMAASSGAVLIVLVTTYLEIKIGIFDEQTTIHSYFLLAMLGASIAEEVVFRGYLIVSKKGKILLVASALLFSTLFAIFHPYLWTNIIEDPSLIQKLTGLRIQPTTAAIVPTLSIFTLSCWFYYVRFSSRNPKHSLLPCFFAHACANLTVYIIKLLSGFVTW